MNTQFKNKVKADKFMAWYLSDWDTTHSTAQSLISGLVSNGVVNMTARQLFDECGYIPQSICEVDGDAEYMPSEVELVDIPMNIDGETTEAFIRAIGMEEQILRQLIMTMPDDMINQIIEEKNTNFTNQ
jgi:hypothetical protein